MKKIIRKVIKHFWGIDSISLFVKKQKKFFLQKVYKKKYSADDLVEIMCSMGMQNGSVVFIHSAMTEFYNYTGSAIELIDKVIDVIGPEGTLLMPAYPKGKTKILDKGNTEEKNIDFDVNKTPSGAGYLSEVFRTYPGVTRSINLQHSVCAVGRLAEEFTSEHHLSVTAWDEFSPYYKLGQVDGLIFSFGLEAYLRNVTLIHCTEAKFRTEISYYNSFFGKNVTYTYLDENGNQGAHEMILPLKVGVRSKNVIKKYFDQKSFKRGKISNLNIEMVVSSYMFNRCVELTENNVSVYESPLDEKFKIEGKFERI